MNVIGAENINESLSIHYLIYKIVNESNGKYYIGQHMTDNPYDSYMGSGIYIKQAERKYGLSCFSKEILFDFDNFAEMNAKENELVQLSNCFPYDQMSYNFAIGGSTQMTPDVYKRRGKTYSQNFQRLTDEEKRARHANQAKAIRRHYAGKSSKQIALETNQKQRKETLANKPKEEIEKSKQKWRDSMNQRSKEQKDETTRKRLASLKRRSKKEKVKTRKKFLNTLANQSEEHRRAVGHKRSMGIKAHYKRHPEQARLHSKRMSGKGNPSYGKVWMVNKVAKHRIFVKRSEIKRFQKNGYEVGYKLT